MLWHQPLLLWASNPVSRLSRSPVGTLSQTRWKPAPHSPRLVTALQTTSTFNLLAERRNQKSSGFLLTVSHQGGKKCHGNFRAFWQPLFLGCAWVWLLQVFSCFLEFSQICFGQHGVYSMFLWERGPGVIYFAVVLDQPMCYLLSLVKWQNNLRFVHFVVLLGSIVLSY